MSGNSPENPSSASLYDVEVVHSHELSPKGTLREWILPGILFFLTFFSMSFAGLFPFNGDIAEFLSVVFAVFNKPDLILRGFPFSISLMIILLAHEMGHFLACRYYGMQCTPPFFIPAPNMAGTFGAFIKIKSQFLHKRALFDIGVAGPLAGFLFIIPILWYGVSLSSLVPKGTLRGAWMFGEPLIFRLIGELSIGYMPERQDMIAHPLAMAAWVGLLVTSLNLLPIWQLDGGHIAYAIFGRTAQKKLSIWSLIVLILNGCWGLWPPRSILHIFFALLLLVFGTRYRFFHPPTLIEHESLGWGRLTIGFLALLVLIISFTPVPVSF